MRTGPARVLVIGYGNPGRLDDGLGPALAQALEQDPLPGVDVESDYQLTVEDAEAVAGHDAVVFVDAATREHEPYGFEPVVPADDATFTTHAVSPRGVMYLAASLFEARTPGYVLGIRGYEFNEFGERLSTRARENLQAALAFLRSILENNARPEGDVLSALEDAAGDRDNPCKTENT